VVDERGFVVTTPVVVLPGKGETAASGEAL
jgi:hypothetical protein